jgi:uncharacterized protein YeeX (DUF496 family)
MMTLQDVKKAIDNLSPEERRELREYLERRESSEPFAQVLSPEERIRRMDAAVETIRAGMSQAELDDMTAAMNAEYIEPFDEDVWRE